MEPAISVESLGKSRVKAKKQRQPRAVPAQTCHGHDHAPEVLHSQVLARLKEAGLKLTRPRQMLLESLSSFKTPFSADELFATASKRHRSTKLDLVTVYRTLATLSDLEVLAKVELGDGVVRYELVDPEGHHHHHFICRSCQKIEPLDLCELTEQESWLSKRGYTNLSHRLEFFGLCPECTK